MDQKPLTKPHVLHVFSTFGVGGQQTRFTAVANALAGKFRHTVVAMDGDFAAATALDASADCAFTTIPVIKASSISLANVRAARGLLRKLKPDLLISYNWGAIEWTLADWPTRFCPHLHIEDGFGPGESPSRQNLRRVLTRRVLLRRCRLTIVPSKTLYDLACRVWRLPPKRMMYLPNGIDSKRFAREPDDTLLTAFGLENNKLVIGTVAGLRAEKNLTRLVRAFAQIPAELDSRLVIVGDGPERSTIEVAAGQLGVRERVILTGPIALPERLLKRFDIFALTSDTEQMPNSILEAMAAGRPIVATDVGDVKQMLAEENRPFVFPLSDEAGFSHALHKLLLDPELRGHIGARNADYVRTTYDFETMVGRYELLFARGNQGRNA